MEPSPPHQSGSLDPQVATVNRQWHCFLTCYAHVLGLFSITEAHQLCSFVYPKVIGIYYKTGNDVIRGVAFFIVPKGVKKRL